ncbi:DUF6624 domain-containing protein [Pedobacter zeae]|uniref:Lipoprotein n=2 Tax=Pedobacter zeae TaxID=1737356 RepID=A0A7W6KAC1_9SPHI|nr:DUF6624 domain-containing protein [Pedobacter zeae]MBB4106922.1 hypothetical protein [Pedobacter zeae]
MKNILSIITCMLLISCASRKMTVSQKEAVLKELKYIYDIDQKFAGLPPKGLIDQYGNKKGWEIFLAQRDSVGNDNQKRIKKLYQQYGYLGLKQVGEKETDFWISIQHADNDIAFQKQMLNVLKKEIRRNNAPKIHYAMLEDRIAVNLKQKQRFGSQVTYNKIGQAIPKIGLIDSANVEKLRKEYDMPSFKKYYNDMTMMHFEMNKEQLKKIGINEPQLYK